MARQSKAVVCRTLNEPVSVETVEVESPRRDEVMVKMKACGVCHSDLSATNGTIPLPPPLVLGHEAAGVIEEIGEGVTEVAVGDPVIICWIPMCGVCRYCSEGRPVLCERAAKAAYTLPDGTQRYKDADGNPLNHFTGVGVMSEYATVHKSNVIALDAEIPPDKAALVGCAVMTGVGAAFNTAKMKPGSSAVVVGCGGVGLNAVQGAALSGADVVVAIDTDDKKLELAQQFGATHTVNATRDDPVKRTREITAGGADYGFDCVGIAETTQQMLDALGRGGTGVMVGLGNPSDTVPVSPFRFIFTEKTLKGSLYGSAQPHFDFARLLSLYKANRLKLDELVTATYSIDDAQRAFDDMVSGVNARGVIVF